MDENKNIQNNGGNPQNAGATNTQTPKKSGGAKVFIIILIIVLVIAGLGVGAFFLTRNIRKKFKMVDLQYQLEVEVIKKK